MPEAVIPRQHSEHDDDAKGRLEGVKKPVLSKRLERILSMIQPAKLLADIGTDHAYVPIAAVNRGLCDRALACDIISGPLERAKANIEAAGLSDRIGIRRGDGLEALDSDRPDCVVIAGMGGSLMVRILWDGFDKLENDPQLVLSPQSEWMEFRLFLFDHHWRICREAMVEEDGKFYLILDCESECRADVTVKRTDFRYGDPAAYDPEDLPVRRAYILKDLQTARSILRQLEGNESPAAAARRKELEELIEDAEGALGKEGAHESSCIIARRYLK